MVLVQVDHRYDTPTGAPCPRTVRLDGSVERGGTCLGCGMCLQFGGLVDTEPLLVDAFHRSARYG